MKVHLILYGEVTEDNRRGFAMTLSLLARRLLDKGLLGTVACGSLGDTDLPSAHVLAVADQPVSHLLEIGMQRLSRVFPSLTPRAFNESLLDRLAAEKLPIAAGDLLVCTRPLFPLAAAAARRLGAEVWVQTSIPHPLLNYALVRNEEIRWNLPRSGPYSDAARAVRLARSIQLADRVLTYAPAVGRWTYESYRQLVGADKVQPLERFFCVDPRVFAARPANPERSVGEGGPTFLHVSHMNLIKGVPYLLTAWRQLWERGVRGGRLVLVGRLDANLRALVRRDFADLPGLELRGFVPDLPAQYTEADAFVSPSVSDAGPTTILEAMAAGLPVISSRNCGFASLLEDGREGFTYDYNDVERLSHLLEWFITHPDAIAPMGTAARRRLSTFSIDGYLDEFLQLVDARGRG
jgi:glycosyltransferase involved in cell wall biosynthesis